MSDLNSQNIKRVFMGDPWTLGDLGLSNLSFGEFQHGIESAISVCVPMAVMAVIHDPELQARAQPESSLTCESYHSILALCKWQSLSHPLRRAIQYAALQILIANVEVSERLTTNAYAGIIEWEPDEVFAYAEKMNINCGSYLDQARKKLYSTIIDATQRASRNFSGAIFHYGAHAGIFELDDRVHFTPCLPDIK